MCSLFSFTAKEQDLAKRCLFNGYQGSVSMPFCVGLLEKGKLFGADVD